MRFRRHRYPSDLPVTVKSSFGETRCQISNVNETGARLTGISGLVRGDALTVILSIGRAQAIVKWVANDQIGLAFRPLIPLSFVDAMRRGPNSRQDTFRHAQGYREMR